MADRQLAFSIFLKLLELSENEKARTLRGFLRGGGFNYWRPLQSLAPRVVAGEIDLPGIQDKVGGMAKSHQRKYNEHALMNLLKWVGRRRVQLRTRPEKLVIKFGNSGLKVKLEPEVAFRMDGSNYLMHIWATNNPTLTEETLSMGLYFFRYHSRKAGFNDYRFLIFDTVKNRLFTEISVLSSASQMIADQRTLLSDLWTTTNSVGEADQPASGEPQEDRPGDQPGTPL